MNKHPEKMHEGRPKIQKTCCYISKRGVACGAVFMGHEGVGLACPKHAGNLRAAKHYQKIKLLKEAAKNVNQ